jgi:hypothetical protein
MVHARDLSDDSSSANRPGRQGDIDRIERLADTKGVDIDRIDVRESTTDDGDPLVAYRVYTDLVLTDTDAVDEEASVGFQVSKLPNSPLGDEQFWSNVQRKLSSAKQHTGGSDSVSESESGRTDTEESDRTEDDDESDSTNGRSGLTTVESGSEPGSVLGPGYGPGARIDHRLDEITDRLDDIEARVDRLDEQNDELASLRDTLAGISADTIDSTDPKDE